MITARAVRHITAILFAFCGLLLTVSSAESSTYVIRKGDSPSSIAKKHGVPLKALLNANKISPTKMKVGTKIEIPEKMASRDKKKKNAARADRSAAKRVRGSEAAGRKNSGTRENDLTAASVHTGAYHTVRKGDTLSSLSRKYSLTTAELKELNNLKSKKLRAGQQLLVKKIGPKTYTVKKGDTIWKVARRFDMEVEDLMALNELSSHDLNAGQKLYLEEKIDEATALTYQEILGKNVEEEIKKVSQSEEFAEQKTQDKVITFARKMLNIPYKFGGNSILGIDCSAYVKKVYGLLGVDLPRTAREQFKEGEAIEREELSIGDLVFFRTYASFPSHVGIYLGNDLFIHASSRGKKVTIDSLETPYYIKRFIGGKRLLTEAENEKEPKG